jgi:hypothetical protein
MLLHAAAVQLQSLRCSAIAMTIPEDAMACMPASACGCNCNLGTIGDQESP